MSTKQIGTGAKKPAAGLTATVNLPLIVRGSPQSVYMEIHGMDWFSVILLQSWCPWSDLAYKIMGSQKYGPDLIR